MLASAEKIAPWLTGIICLPLLGMAGFFLTTYILSFYMLFMIFSFIGMLAVVFVLGFMVFHIANGRPHDMSLFDYYFYLVCSWSALGLTCSTVVTLANHIS